MSEKGNSAYTVIPTSGRTSGSRVRLIGDVLKDVVRHASWSKRTELHALREAWFQAAGETTANRTRIVGLKGGILTIAVESSTLRHEMEAYRRKELLRRLGEASRRIQDQIVAGLAGEAAVTALAGQRGRAPGERPTALRAADDCKEPMRDQIGARISPRTKTGGGRDHRATSPACRERTGVTSIEREV